MISYKYLEYKLNELQKLREKDNKFCKAIEDFIPDSVAYCINSDYEVIIIGLLERLLCGDNKYDDTLSYWYYECKDNNNFGKIETINGKEYILNNLKDVYDYYKFEINKIKE